MNKYGYTLIELLVALAISLIITIGVTRFFSFQYGLFATETEEIGTTQTLRSILHMLGREIILAGYGIPSGMAKITRSLADEIEFRTNLKDIKGKLRSAIYPGENILYLDIPTRGFKKDDRIILCKGIDRGINRCGEYFLAFNGTSNVLILRTSVPETYPEGSTVNRIDTISYRYNKDKKRLERKINRGHWQPFGEGIGNVRFKYLDGNNKETGDPARISRIDMTLTSPLRNGRNMKITRTIVLRN